MRVAIIYIVLFNYVASNAFSQKKMDLSSCIDYAIKNNLIIQNNRIEYRKANEYYRQSKRNLTPSIHASSNAQVYFGRSIDENTNDYVNQQWFSNSYGLSSSITLFNGFQKLNTIRLNKFLQQNAKQAEQKEEDELAFQVMRSYFDVCFYTQLIKIAEEQVETSRFELRSMTRQVELGLKSKSYLLEIKASLKAEELYLLQMQNSKDRILMNLKKHMNFPQEDTILIEEFREINHPIQSWNLDDAFKNNENSDPGILQAQAVLNASRKRLAISKGLLLPSISAYAGLSSGFYETAKNDEGRTINFHSQLSNNLSEYVGVSLSIPIWHRWSHYSNVKLSKLNYLQAQNNYQIVKQSYDTDLEEDIQKMNALQKEYVENIEQNKLNEQAFNVAQKKLNKGLIDVVTYFLAKNRLAQAQAQKLNVEMQIRVQYNLLQYYKGIRFWE